jgi:acyl-CoA reductase-like NAD-dependent aldehyde dehydrogenase
MNDTRYGLTAGVYTPDEARARSCAVAGECRQRVLELLRPREPAPALERCGRLGRGPDLSTYGIQTFTRPKAWHLRKACAKARWCG